MNKIKEITDQAVSAEKKIDICSHIFYSVAEISARDDNRVKMEAKPNTGFIDEPDWISLFIHRERWRTLARKIGREKARKNPDRNVIFFYFNMFFFMWFWRRTPSTIRVIYFSFLINVLHLSLGLTRSGHWQESTKCPSEVEGILLQALSGEGI